MTPWFGLRPKATEARLSETARDYDVSVGIETRRFASMRREEEEE
jgi:hypothetical protein